MTPDDFARYEREARSLWHAPSSTLNLLSRPPGDPYDWRQLAACAETDPDSFFPEQGAGNGHTALFAKRVCANCDVRQECLEFALKHDIQYGIWGGYTGQARRKIAWRRRQWAVAV